MRFPIPALAVAFAAVTLFVACGDDTSETPTTGGPTASGSTTSGSTTSGSTTSGSGTSASGTSTAATGAACGNLTDCDGSCVDTTVDPSNCGGCDNACGMDEVCSDGACGLQCFGGTTRCGALCVDTDLDPEHCGDCDNACMGDEVCSGGTCGLQCSGGTTLCDGLCADTTVDPAHCGTCPNACESGDLCLDSICVRVTTIGASNRGWWDENGSHDGSVNNTFTGEISGVDLNSYFSFDLGQVTGTVLAVTLVLTHESGVSPGNETLSIWDVSTDEFPLETSNNSVAIWSDLETGLTYGSFVGGPGTLMTDITTPLDAQAVADVQANLGGGFSVGISCDTCSGIEGVRFSSVNEHQTHHLIVTHAP